MNNENKGQSFDTPDADKTYLPPWVLEKMALGEKKKLWAIEIIYVIESDHHRFWKPNLTRDELYKWRESIFRYGITHPLEPRHWLIIPPVDIVKVTCIQQEKYLPEQF